MRFGDQVKAYPLDGTGPKVGFYIGTAGDKDQIQVGDNINTLAFRQPANYDDAGPNGTWCTISG